MTAVRTSLPALWLLVASVSLAAQAPAPASATDCAQIWVGHEAEYEAFLKSATVASMKAVPVGVTKPSRAYFAPGGLAESMAWKAITPGMKNGFYESYRSEIAAYELDKMLGLQMVPPTVERQVERTTGAAVLWATPTRSFKELGGVPGQAEIPRAAPGEAGGLDPSAGARQDVRQPDRQQGSQPGELAR